MWRIPASRGHPLGVAVGDQAAATDGVHVTKGPVDHVCHRLEATVGVPRGSLGLTRRIFHFTHLVHVDERIEDPAVHAGEGAPDREALPFEPSGSCGHSHYRSPRCRPGLWPNHTGKGQNVVHGHCRHGHTPVTRWDPTSGLLRGRPTPITTLVAHATFHRPLWSSHLVRAFRILHRGRYAGRRHMSGDTR